MYQDKRKNTLYRSVMNVIIKANEELFKEESDVCEAIIDLFRDEYDKGIEEAKQQGIEFFVLEYLEDGFSAEQITKKLVRRFSMTEEQAKETVERYRK